jgi:hypothetical protein
MSFYEFPLSCLKERSLVHGVSIKEMISNSEKNGHMAYIW